MPKNAAIYIADPSMLGSRLFDRVEGIESYEGTSDGSTATGVRFKFPWGSIAMKFMPPGDIAEHLEGFSGYAQHVIKDRDKLIYTLARIHNVRMSLGCVIEHDEEDTEAVHDFLFGFNAAVNGLLFLYDSIFDFAGEPLGGPAADDQELESE